MTKHTNGVKHEVFPDDSNGAPLMGWRAKPRLEMKLQASALPPAIMAAHALTTPMQAPQIHWVRLQHTISPKVWKLDLKNWGKSLNFSDSSWTSLNNMEWFLSLLGTSHVAHVIWNDLSKDVHRHATLESVRATAVFQGKADVSEPSKTF